MDKGVDISGLTQSEQPERPAPDEGFEYVDPGTPITTNEELIDFLEQTDPQAATFYKAIETLSKRINNLEMTLSYFMHKNELMEKHVAYLASKDPVLSKEIDAMRKQLEEAENAKKEG